MASNQRSEAMLLAVAAVLFYAISIPFSKLLLKQIEPTMMGALLYLGAGIGVGILSLCTKKHQKKQESLQKKDLPYMIAMVVLDITAVILLMYGVQETTAANASLLSNLEIVTTAVIAYFVFHEAVSKRMWIALLLVTCAGIILSFDGQQSMQFSYGSLLVIGSAAAWGMENNCTKMLSSKNTYQIVILKGICSGCGSLLIAVLLKESLPLFSYALGALLLGFVSYGLSIFAYIRCQNIIGAAKTSAFYAINPFVAALLSFFFLQESLSCTYFLGLAVMIAGAMVTIWDTLHSEHQ